MRKFFGIQLAGFVLIETVGLRLHKGHPTVTFGVRVTACVLIMTSLSYLPALAGASFRTTFV